jgi:hypothetical protein
LQEAHNIKLLEGAPFFDISSTELRKNLQDWKIFCIFAVEIIQLRIKNTTKY